MSLEIETVLGQNIVLVYESLELKAVDRNALRELVDVDTEPMVMDTPEVVVAIFPPQSTVIQIDNRRITVTLQRHAKSVGEIPLWEIAVRGHQSIQSTPLPKLVAYGFNYDVVAAVEGNSQEIVTDLFLANVGQVEEAIGGQLVAFIPRFKLTKDTVSYDLVLEPLQEQKLKVHLNAHFEFADIALPDADNLGKSFCQEFGFFSSFLLKLFSSGEV
jgi:hypothetical protein